jgi:uncharacterized protein YbaP (TraB family)
MNFKTLYPFILFLAAFVFILPACKQTQKIPTEVEPKIEDYSVANSLLWKISGKDLTTDSYLYGTIHIINDEDYFLPGGTLSAIDQSEKIVFEIDMAEMNDISKQLGLLKDAFMKDGLTLKDLLTDEEYKIVGDHFKKIGMPLFLFERIKPMFLTVFASGDLDPQDLQSGKIKSYEMEFYDIATRSDKAVGGLETIEFQMSIFDSIPYQDQANMLVESIKVADTEGDQFKEMIDVYKRQDLNAMQSMFEEEDTGLQGYEDILLVKRNQNWIPIMAEMMKEQTAFFAVGAGHLGGKYGVIQLLKEAGYTLTPLSETNM